MRIKIIVVLFTMFQLYAKEITIINTTDKKLGLFLRNVYVYGHKPTGEEFNIKSDPQYILDGNLLYIKPGVIKFIKIENQKLGEAKFRFDDASAFFLKGLLSEEYWGSGHIQTIPIDIHDGAAYIVIQVGNDLQISKLPDLNLENDNLVNCRL